MEHVIAKPINTESQRLSVGDPVTPEDHLAPHDFATLKSAGFIVEKAADMPAPTSRFMPRVESSDAG